VLPLAGLAGAVEVVRDGRGVPHVRAGSEADAWFALGFVHAQDRLAEMTWLVRAARGRTAEVLGAGQLGHDRLVRTLGVGRYAELEAGRLDPDTRRVLEAYAAGVNSRIARIRAGREAPPVPLARLAVPLEDWNPADSLAVVKLLAWGLDGAVAESLVLWELIQHLGGFAARPLFPPDAADRLVPLPPERSVQRRPPGLLGSVVALRRGVGVDGRSAGSSAWLVSGARSASSKPLLAADLHLEPTVPALLYEAHLDVEGMSLAGATIPGVPVFWTGHNGRVAWAATHARILVTDLYIETLKEGGPLRYHDGRSWRPVSVREETIAVQGGPAVRLDVRETGHGPLLDGILEGASEPLAVAWPGARAGNGVAGLVRAGRAGSAAEFRHALAEHHEPALAFLFADTSGEGGLQVAGFVPERGLPSALVPVPGRSRWSDWRGSVPFDRLPRASLGADGDWLVAADNVLGPGGDPRALEWWWRPGERAHRIDALLRSATARAPLDPLTLTTMQLDVHAENARERARLALHLAGPLDALPREAREVAEILGSWDGRADAVSVGAAAYHAFLLRLLREMLRDSLGAELLDRYLRLRGAAPEELLGQILAGAAAGSGDGALELVDRERIPAAVREALRETGLALLVRLGTNRERWTWGRLHPLRFRPLGWPEASWGGPSSLTPVPYGGDGGTIAVAEYDPVDPFEVRLASVYRFVVDLADLEIGLASLAPGANEHPGHPLRTAGLAAWLDGRPGLLPAHPVLVGEAARARLRLEPAP
jgi:penicillin amidase